MNDNVLFGVAGIFSEEINAACVTCILFDADSQNNNIIFRQIKRIDGKRRYQFLVNIDAGMIDTNFFQHSVLRGIGGPIGDRECFLNDLCKELKKQFAIKRIDIVSGEGIIILGERR